ncbi:MAG TPA: TonB-dependent receptor [Steroidobacteraceae bacterium]|nr:TonB-dependent receptor [Steroidobacteraceae bacterium]
MLTRTTGCIPTIGLGATVILWMMGGTGAALADAGSASADSSNVSEGPGPDGASTDSTRTSPDANNATEGLQEVTVTANKLNAQNVMSVPASIQAISGEQLMREDASGIMSIAGEVPGLSIQTLGPGDNKYVIRGINSTGESTTGLYYGEAVVTQGNSDDGGGFEPDIRLYDMDRVEVLRGPQGTLYGASSMSGTIRMIPRSPDLSDTDGYANAEGSDTQHTIRDNYRANGMLNLPIVSDVLAVRVVAWKVYDAGYIDQIRVGEGVSSTISPGGPVMPVQPLGLLQGVNDDDVGGVRAILRYQPMQNLTFDADYTAQTETSGGSSRYTPAGVAAFSGGPIPPAEGCDLCNTDVTQSPWSDNLKVFGLTMTWKTGAGVITATDHQFNRQTGFTFDSTPILVSYDVPVPAETFEPRTRDDNNGEIRFASAFDGPVNFVAGGYREHSAQNLAVDVITTDADGLATGPFSTSNAEDALSYPGVGDTFFGRTDHREDTQYAGFGEATWTIADGWTAVAGVRYFTETLTGVQVQTHPFGGFPPDTNLQPVFDPRETYDKVTWKGNLSYKWSEAVLAYATVSTGFRSGGLNAVSEPFEPIPASYAPDYLTNYELGVKGRLFEGFFDYQVDGYVIDWKNMQEQLTTADGAFVYEGNAGTARVTGVEFELDARLLEYLRATLAGSWQNAYLTQGASADQYALNPTLGLTGDKIPDVPDAQFSVGLDYTRPITGPWSLDLGTDITYRGSEDSYFSSNSFNVPLSSYTLWDLRAGFINGPWTVTAFARNVTNERAQLSAINSSQDPHALLTVQPRTIGVGVTRTF